MVTSQQQWQGCLELEFRQRQGTQLSRSFVQAPLKVQRPFYPEGREVCHVVTLHTAGGVVGGDRLCFNLQLHPQSHALITTAAAGKWYGSKALEATQTAHMAVAEGACLEWLPQETIVFAGAQVRQSLRVELAEDALWLGWEVLRFGRTARGEQFTSGEWRSRTEVWQGDRPLWVDPQWLIGDSSMLTSPHGLWHCPVVGSFAVVGRSVSPEIVEQVRSLIPPSEQAEFGATRLMAGLLCRYRGQSTAEARRWFTAAWSLLRPMVLHRVVCQPRVWQ